jgi:hypothetical protein
MAIPSLLDSYIDETYPRLVQTVDGTEFADGLGNPITFGTTNTGSLLLTASVSLNTIEFTKGDNTKFSITVNTGSGGSVSGDYVTTSSFNAFTGSYNTGSFSGSFIGTLTGTASWASNATTAANILGGKATHIPFFITDTTLATSSIYQSGSTSIIINATANTTDNPEALYVLQPHPTSYNVISGIGEVNNYLQLNIQNTDAGENASSDVVATANTGDEDGGYIDMGINSDGFSGLLGGPLDAYLYATGSHLHIGNATPNKPVQFFTGGTNTDTNRKFELNANNQHNMTGSLDISGSLNVRNSLTSSGLLTNGTNTIEGNTVMSGSSTIQGTTTMTGSLLITGSTTQTGNNTLQGTTSLNGNVTISGSLTVSGSQPGTATNINIYGDTSVNGAIKFLPVTENIDTSVSASYIYVSGSTQDLYFSQNGSGYNNVTRLRWLEGNIYTGLLHGGLITSQSATEYQISSGSGIIANLNASINNDPYPTIQFLQWPNLSASIAPLSASYDQSFVGVQSNGTIFAQGTPFSDGQYDSLIPIGIILHQNHSTINGVKTQPSLAYGWKQRSSVFTQAFGPLKLSGFTVAVSGSSTGSITVSSGTAFSDGANYAINPNSPSYVTDNGTTTSKIFRYRQSGSDWIYDTNNGAGYANLDPVNYNPGGLGVLDTVGTSNYSLQRVYWYPNSVTKAIVVYYGNDRYGTLALAEAAMATEQFTEAPNTRANAIYLGTYAIKGGTNTTLQNAAHFRWMPGGLFRGSSGGSGGGSGGGSTTLAGLSDVSIISPTNHNLLAYNSSTTKWENVSSITANVTGNLTGTADTASYISPTFISASAAASGFGSGGGGDTSGLLSTASFNDYTSSTTAQFAGTASFATTALNLLGSVTSAVTASYADDFTVASTLTIDQTLTDYHVTVASAPATWGIFERATGSYTAAMGKYTIYSGTNARAGEFMTVWNGTTVNFTDVATTDIGSTANLTLQSSLSGGNIRIDAVAASSGPWTIKMLVTYL